MPRPAVPALLAAVFCLGAGSGLWAEPKARQAAPLSADRTDAIATLCDRAGAKAARATGVPRAVLQAISLTETGRNLGGQHRAWPWTVNMEGKGIWFDTRQEAEAYVQTHFARGARSFDVGCFQINYRWHGNAFRSISDMFEPELNALYAGKFLRTLYGEKGSWPLSAGAYHSRTPQFATRYAKRFSRILARLTGQSDAPIPVLAEPGVIPDVVGWPVAGRGVAAFLPDTAPAPAVPPPDGPEHFVPPAPSPTGSVAAVDLLPEAPGLLRRAPGALY